MPKERLQETIPPIGAATLASSGKRLDPAKSEATTVVEIPNRISTVPKAAVVASRSVSPRPKPITSSPPPVTTNKVRPGIKSTLLRIVLPVSLLSFAAGGLIFGHWARGNESEANGEAASSANAAASSVSSAAISTVLSEPSNAAKAPTKQLVPATSSLPKQEKVRKTGKPTADHGNPSTPKSPNAKTGDLSFDAID
jgi:hypothetical protein